MKIGISKGRIEDIFYKRLVLSGIDIYDKNTRRLEFDINDYKLYLLKSIDVISLLSQGYLDLGVVGSDVIDEINNSDIVDIYDLDSGKCSFVLASIPGRSISEIKVIATKYPVIAKKILETYGLNIDIRKMNGSLEVAPLIGYADGIIDLVETGNTLKANGLVELRRFEPISTKIISRKEDKDKDKIKEFIQRIGV